MLHRQRQGAGCRPRSMRKLRYQESHPGQAGRIATQLWFPQVFCNYGQVHATWTWVAGGCNFDERATVELRSRSKNLEIGNMCGSSRAER